MTNLPAHHTCFNIQFDKGHTAKAVRIPSKADPSTALKLLGLEQKRPVIFVSGGASKMDEQDRRLIRDMIKTVAQFADEHNAIIVDGGTEAGVMQLVGEIRAKNNLTFPLIGVSPIGKVAWPGHQNAGSDTQLNDLHTHFILVDGDNWGDESETILHLSYKICDDGKLPAAAILINGGKIALYDMYLASTTQYRLSIIVLEGSGRAADEISMALRTGKSTLRIVQAILKGGDIQLVATTQGPDMMRQVLNDIFEKRKKK